VYTETTLNRDFNPKSAIISKNSNTKNFFLKILTNNIIRDGLSQKKPSHATVPLSIKIYSNESIFAEYIFLLTVIIYVDKYMNSK
jgi:hypothetical protein